MFLFKCIMMTFLLCFIEFFWPDGAHAWGPGIHTLNALSILDNAAALLPAVGRLITSFPLEYLYGCLSADFFLGKSKMKDAGHLHNWRGGFKLLNGAKDERQAAYACGFLSHLVADVIAHNYFIPNIISRYPHKRATGHLYWELRADHAVGPLYTKIARDVLHMDHREFDKLMKMMIQKKGKGLKPKRRLYAGTVGFFDYFHATQAFFPGRSGTGKGFDKYLFFMVDLSGLLVRDFLKGPESSPCLLYDPMGTESLRLAKIQRSRNRFFKTRRYLRRIMPERQPIKP